MMSFKGALSSLSITVTSSTACLGTFLTLHRSFHTGARVLDFTDELCGCNSVAPMVELYDRCVHEFDLVIKTGGEEWI